MVRSRRLRPRQREAGRDRGFRPGGSASPSSDENSEDSKLRRLAFMALAANTLKPGSSMAESRIRRFQDQALRALASQVVEADGSGHGDNNLQRLAFMALATSVLKPGTSTTESRIRRFQDDALRALASQAREANDGRGNPQQLAFVALASQVLKPGDANKESLIREFQDQVLLAPNPPTLNSEDPSTDIQGPQNEESIAPDSQAHSDNSPNTRGRDSRGQSSGPQPRQTGNGESQSEDPRSTIWHQYHRKLIICKENRKLLKPQFLSDDEPPSKPDTRVCANCGESGHGVDMFMIPREDGYVHGCVFCNTIDHGTTQCAKFSWDFESRIKVLVQQRGSMPPLKDAPWRKLTQEYIQSSLIWFEDGFPWTPEFGKRVLKAPDLLEEARKGIKIPGYRPMDPNTATWATIEDTMEGSSGKFKEKLIDMCWI
ncbi:hypothetical protein CEP53_000737 [Fusarium sp. AF-6]|nr:hypothetical protein CEP53_000737 [Fusarium sp. AF-6]